MFKRQINYEKLKLKLQVCVQQLDIILKRKKLRALKKRKEITHLVQIQKKKKARTCVEQILPIDCHIEAGEILKKLCALLIENIGVIEKSDILQGDLIEAIYCITWAAPYLKHEVLELEDVAHLLTAKFGKLCKSIKHRNVVYENLKKKLILARSGQWLSPKTIEDYLVHLTKHYETRDYENRKHQGIPKIISNGDKWRLGYQTISQPPRISGDHKVGYRRPSVGTYVNERPWTTLRVQNANVESRIGHSNLKQTKSENVAGATKNERPSRIPRSIVLKNNLVGRSNSMSIHQARRGSILSMSSFKSLSGSLTSLKSSKASSSSTTSLYVEEYVSILDTLFNFDKPVPKNNSATIAEEPDISNDCDKRGISSNNWGKLSLEV